MLEEFNKHVVGNCYKLLDHTLVLRELFPNIMVGNYPSRCLLSCQPGCCTLPYGIQLKCSIDDLDNLEVVKRLDRPAKSRIDWQEGDAAIIKEHWMGTGKKLYVLGPAVFLKQWWVPVENSEDGEPTFFKEAGLEKGENEK